MKSILEQNGIERTQRRPRPGFWQRVLAFMLDVIFLSAALIPLEAMPGKGMDMPMWPACLAQVIILFAWFYLSWTSPMQGTLMMRWCGVRLRGLNGTDAPHPGYLLLRWVVMFAPLLVALPMCVSPTMKLVGLAWFPILSLTCMFNKRRRGLHDLAGRCRVVVAEEYVHGTPKWFDAEREDIESRLARLRNLHATGVITDDELQAQRRRILDSI
jgi:uncharacterized RDD family membrane protein YckC